MRGRSGAFGSRGSMGKDREALYFFFYYPIGVDRERGPAPWVSWSLMAVMIGVFVYFRFDRLSAMLAWEWWVYFPQQPLRPGLFLSIINHGGWMHLLGNLVYLWTFGPSIERVLGPWRFLLAFLFLGIFSNLSQGLVSTYVLTQYSHLGVVGASGALPGLMGMFLLRFPAARIRTAWVIFSPLHGLARSGILPIPSLLAIGCWILLQVVQASTVALGGHDGTAYGAHFGGLILGILVGLGYGFPKQGKVFRRRHRVTHRLAKGDWMGAYEAVQPLLDSKNPEDLSIAARVTRIIGEQGHSRDLYRKAVRAALDEGDEVGAAHVYAEALRIFPDMAFLETAQYRLALALDRLGHASAALRALEIFLVLFKDSDRVPLVLIRAARLEEAQDPDRARKLYQEQLDHYPDSPYCNLSRRAIQALA